MQRIEDAISEARRQLPQAFSRWSCFAPPRWFPFTPPLTPTCEPLPPSNKVVPLKEVSNDAKHLLPSSEEEREGAIKALEQATKSQGIEYLAFYVSFHNPTRDGKWGIFYWDQCIRQLGAKVMRHFKSSYPEKAKELALEIVRRHELFHFRFDLYALHQELSLKRPLYNRYRQKVYSRVLFTDQCYEESLANRCCAYEWPRFSDVEEFILRVGTAATAVLPWQVEDFLKSLWAVSNAFVADADGYRIMKALDEKAPKGADRVEGFVKQFCQAQPAGYKDFEGEPSELRSRLGGQLLSGKLSGCLPKPQADWVGLSSAFAERRFCPEYVLINRDASDSDILHHIVKAGGGWEFHKYDADPWPTDPHGHKLQARDERLDIRTGLVYKGTRKRPIRRLPRKHLERVRQELESCWPDRALPPLAR